MAGRPKKEFDRKSFVDLVGLGCTQEEICWYYRDEEGYICESPYKFTSFVTNLNDYYKNDCGKWVEA